MKAKIPLIIWGASGHALVLHEFIAKLGYHLVALFDNNPELPSPIAGVPLFRGEAGLLRWQQNAIGPTVGLVAIGGSRGSDRLAMQNLLRQHRVEPITAIHPTAFVASDAVIGAGSQVLAQTAVAAAVRIGDACIINTAASVDHECILADGVHIAPGAVVAGCVQIGLHSLVGSGATILPRIRIGNNVIVGAGSVVTRDIPDNTVAYGNPAKPIRSNPTSA